MAISVSFNPCSNGRYSQSSISDALKKEIEVLILVLMEDTLRVDNLRKDYNRYKGFNPCSNGRYSQSQKTKSQEY